MTAGIYCLTVHRRGKADLHYIGQAVDFAKRWSAHLQHLAAKKHDNWRIQALFKKYGAESIAMRAVLICSPENLALYEQAILNFYLARFGRRVLNICRTCSTSPRGVKRSPATVAKIRANRNQPGCNPRLGTKGRGANCLPVECIETGEVFPSIGMAVQWLRGSGWTKARDCAISFVCRDLRESAYGYKWRLKPPSLTVLNSVDYEVKA